ncbi:MAG TPA: TylF/MycF/NovP-related O-methyltransferase [Thauera sp.]|nr:TylF/MycF/NovP-related O-methyltransferase [Thauera sp.]
MLRQLKDCFSHCFPRVYARLWGGGPVYRGCPDAEFYRPLFSPWLGYGGFAEVTARITPHSLVSPDRLWVLHSLARQALKLPGNFWECGVYKGGTAKLLAGLIGNPPGTGRQLRLFDTFSGMPETDPGKDLHRQGDFSDTSLSAVKKVVRESSQVSFHPGFIPQTFVGLEGERIAFAHVDVDIHQSVMDCCHFIHPRLVPGGVMIFDDYGFPTCPGARAAVDAFFVDKAEVPLVLSTGQAVVFKLP